jgi:hypothetical protein
MTPPYDRERPPHGGYPGDTGHPEGTAPLAPYQRAALDAILPLSDQECITEAAMHAVSAEWLYERGSEYDADDHAERAAYWRQRGNYR